jgi:chromosome partitioning protein
MQTILVLNSKGGCGKSTVAVNLASYYASCGFKSTLVDYDPQGSSLQWLSLRSGEYPSIHGVNACRTRSGITRTWQMRPPVDTDHVIIDAPAGTTGGALQEMLRRTDVIIIPVTPSPIDIHATSDFIRELLLIGKARSRGIHIGVIANRVRRDTPYYEPLKRFLGSLNIPFITALTDSDHYITAVESGIGIHELDERETATEREQWFPLVRWLANPERDLAAREARPRLNVISGAGG